ncbi:MAG: transposase [Deltaproteobacteria bacterium]|nr:transposase [Deltaproteobacteria bacterium]
MRKGGEGQMSIDFRTWGGARVGAGRKKVRRKSDPSHRTRDAHPGWHPVHVVLRTLPAVGRLRRRRIYQAIRRAVAKTWGCVEYRIVHISIQHNHLHLLVEASSKETLALGMQSFATCAAKAINKALERAGKVFAHRYHATAVHRARRATRSPTSSATGATTARPAARACTSTGSPRRSRSTAGPPAATGSPTSTIHFPSAPPRPGSCGSAGPSTTHPSVPSKSPAASTNSPPAPHHRPGVALSPSGGPRRARAPRMIGARRRASRSPRGCRRRRRPRPRSRRRSGAWPCARRPGAAGPRGCRPRSSGASTSPSSPA